MNRKEQDPNKEEHTPITRSFEDILAETTFIEGRIDVPSMQDVLSSRASLQDAPLSFVKNTWAFEGFAHSLVEHLRTQARRYRLRDAYADLESKGRYEIMGIDKGGFWDRHPILLRAKEKKSEEYSTLDLTVMRAFTMYGIDGEAYALSPGMSSRFTLYDNGRLQRIDMDSNHLLEHNARVAQVLNTTLPAGLILPQRVRERTEMYLHIKETLDRRRAMYTREQLSQ